MAETAKGAPSSANSKEKSSLLDLDIGNDFLNSWKSISIGDDAMDFDFGPISKNKKKAFNFDKEDMNFNLDSNFGKISSFKSDTSDLDISSPCKKNGNTQGKPKESSGANNKGKTDGFTFNFDFKELDSFCLQPSPGKEDQSKKDLEIEGCSETSAHLGSPKKHSVPEMTMASTADSLADSGLTPDPIGKNCSSGCTANNNDASISATVTHKSELRHTRISPTRSTSTNTVRSEFQIESGISPQPVVQEANDDISHHSSGHESSNNAGSDLLEEVGSLGAKISSSDVEKDLERIDDRDNNVSLETDQESGKHVLVSNIEGDNTVPECSYIASAKKDEHFTNVNEIKEPIPQPLKAPSSSGFAVQNLMRGKGECSAIRSKFFMPSAAQKQNKSLMQTKYSDAAKRRIGTSQPNHADDGMAQIPGIPGSTSLPKCNTLLTGSQHSFKGLSINTSHVIKPLSISQQGKSMLQNSGNPRVVESPVGGNKICPIKAGRQTLDFSSSKLPRNLGASLSVSQSLLLKDGKTLRSHDQNTSPKATAQANVTDSITPSPQLPKITPLKRKTPEVCFHQENSEDQAISNKRVECDSSHAVDKKELGALQTMEDDENVDNAEAYTKELEDICNMLRKKHEEAKELLVRSIVNNNKLLMLNHPIHEEKISFFMFSYLYSVPKKFAIPSLHRTYARLKFSLLD